MYSTLIVLCLSLGSVTIISGQRQIIDAQILDEGGVSSVLQWRQERELEMKLLTLQFQP